MMLDSAGRWLRIQGQTLWLCEAGEQEAWGCDIPFSPPGTTHLLLNSMFSSSYTGGSSTGGQAGFFIPPPFLVGQKLTPQIVRNTLLLSRFSLFLATFIFMSSSMKHFYFRLNNSSLFRAFYALQTQHSHRKLSHLFDPFSTENRQSSLLSLINRVSNALFLPRVLPFYFCAGLSV